MGGQLAPVYPTTIKGKKRVVFPLIVDAGATEEEVTNKMVMDIIQIIAGVRKALDN